MQKLFSANPGRCKPGNGRIYPIASEFAARSFELRTVASVMRMSGRFIPAIRVVPRSFRPYLAKALFIFSQELLICNKREGEPKPHDRRKERLRPNFESAAD